VVGSSVFGMQSIPAPVTSEEVRGWRLRVCDAAVAGDDADLVDEVGELEVLKAAIEARQARIAVAFDLSQREQAVARGVRPERQGKGVAEQLALARRVSPHRGRILLGLAKTVVNEMPWTAKAWRQGRISEHRALVLARETACLTREDRAEVDAALAADPAALEAKSDRRVEGEARALAARLDAASVAERRRRAETDRCVTIRPAPDAMVYLTALLPLAHGVATYAALSRAADAAVAAGDPRSRGQLMADTLTTRTTGTHTGADTGREVAPGVPGVPGVPVVPVAINLVMSDQALLDPTNSEGTSEEAEITGYGPIPAGLARDLIAHAHAAGLKTWLRRLYAHPLTGRLVAMDSDQRLFPKQLGNVIGLRDRFCRHPWCNARIRHRDHITPATAGGPTSIENGQGLCEACNQTKTLPGWTAHGRDHPGNTHTVTLTTPTGHTYHSTAPPLPGTGLHLKLDPRFAA
jgi:hypothetical protein